ncbi:MAG: hypothetical protein NT045_04525 [Candidatus Aureabacteria bacterium]|nr:hypothetical protein [Candidatus Auribacterota bacterium]
MKSCSLRYTVGVSLVLWGAVNLLPSFLFFFISVFLLGFLTLRLVDDRYAAFSFSTIIFSSTASIALTSLAIHYTACCCGFKPPLIMLVLAAAVWLLLVLKPISFRWQPTFQFGTAHIAFCVILLVTLFFVYRAYSCCFFPNVGRDSIAYMAETGDFKKNLAFTGALLSTGYPPVNPFFALKKLTYYFGYHLPIAMLSSISGGTVGLLQGWGIYIVITSALFVGMAYLLSRSWIRCTCGVVIALLCMTVAFGLDILPMRYFGILGYNHIDRWSGSMGEFGDIPLVNTFYSLFIWVPQHLFGASILLLVVMLIKEMQEASLMSVRLRYAVVTIIIFRAIIGYSLFIASIGGMILFSTGVIQMIQAIRRPKNLIPAVLTILIPICGSLIALDQLTMASGANNLAPFYPHAWQLKIGLFWQYLVVWCVVYPLEFGPTYVLGIAGICWALRRKKFSFLPLFLYFATLIPFVAISVRKSELWNDWGMRCIIPAQIALSVFTGYFCCLFLERFKNLRVRLCLFIPLIALLAIGFYGTFYESQNRSRPLSIPRTLHESFLWIRNNTPPNSFIVAPDETLDYLTSMLATISYRGSVSHIVPEYAHDTPLHIQTMAVRHEIFKAVDFQTASALSQELGADYLLLNKHGIDSNFKRAGFHNVPPALFSIEYESDDLILYKVIKTTGTAPKPSQRPLPVQKTPTRRSPGKEALDNAGFELVSTNGLPEGWEAKTFKSSVEVCIDSAVHHAGKHSIRICSSTGGDGGIAQQVFLKANSTYLLSAWVKAEGLSTDGKGALIGLEGMEDKSLIWPAGTYDWTYKEKKILIEAAMNHPLAMYIGGWGTSKGCAYFDDVCLLKIEPVDK